MTRLSLMVVGRGPPDPSPSFWIDHLAGGQSKKIPQIIFEPKFSSALRAKIVVYVEVGVPSPPSQLLEGFWIPPSQSSKPGRGYVGFFEIDLQESSSEEEDSSEDSDDAKKKKKPTPKPAPKKGKGKQV